MQKILIKGARVHNLKNINVAIPRGKFVVITGLSGSGKSSLAFDTLYAEGKRRYLESLSPQAAQFFETSTKAICHSITGLSPTVAIGQELIQQNPRSTVGTISEIYDYLRLLFSILGQPICFCGSLLHKEKIEKKIQKTGYWRQEEKIIRLEIWRCKKCGKMRDKFEPRHFSFNSPYGACSACSGLGTKLIVDEELVLPNKKLSIAEGGIRPWQRFLTSTNNLMHSLEKSAQEHHFSLNTPIKDLTSSQIKIVLYGTPPGYEGVIPNLERRRQETDSPYLQQEIEQYMRCYPCPICQGQRLKKESLLVRFADKNIAEISDLSLEKLIEFFATLKLSLRQEKIAQEIIKAMKEKIKACLDVGVGYLTLSRSSETLAGGEIQRLRLARQLQGQLAEIIYIFDEPTVGLHPKDNVRLIKTLKKLRDKGNTIIVVEHDLAMIKNADYIIDMGPGAGEYGGKVVAIGTFGQIKKKKTLTAQYLNGQLKIAEPAQYRQGNGKYLLIKGAQEFNLKNLDVKIPLGLFVAVTGVSGSGKSTLICEILAKALARHFYQSKDLPGKHKKIEGLQYLDKVIHIDQSPIGRTPRSNPATYTGLFTHIRDLYTELPEAKGRGFGAGHFSFNVKGGGRCETCQGEGMQKISLHFLPDVYVECPECEGRRYNKKVLDIYYKGKNIADILAMSVEDAYRFFYSSSPIREKLTMLREVGLGYIKLGQSATTLSGGEAQRVKLATELARRATGKTIYLLDEPTTGLHFADIKKLLAVLQKLVDKGNTVLVIEHNLDVIKCADWLIDLGPEGGDKGGYLVAQGTPEEVSKNKKSYTGQYLKKVI